MPKNKKVVGSVVDPKYQSDHYKVSKVKTAGGKRFAVDKDDTVAKQLRGKDMKELRAIARENGLVARFDEKWGKLNPGLCRMALGNSLRGLANPKKAKAKKKKAA